MFKTMFVSGLTGIFLSRLINRMFGDAWTVYICLVTSIVMLILLNEMLSYISTIWIGHILFSSIIGFTFSLIVIESSPWPVFNHVLLKITFSAITLLGIVVIGYFIKETYRLFKKFYPKKTIYVE